MAAVSVDTQIEHVTVYASGARVRRVAMIPAPLPTRVRIVGLPLSVIDDTLCVEVGGPAVATSVRVGVEAPAAADAAGEDSAELRGAKCRVSVATSEVERIHSALELLAATPVIEMDASEDAPAPWSAVVAARRAVVAIRADRELALHAQHAAARHEAEQAQRALEAIVDRELRTGTARLAKLHELRTYVEIELVATAASEIAIHIEYLVAAARWAPSYIARIDGERVTFEIRAVVAQDAGEDWSRVPLKLSTAEPERFAALPELAAQKIGRRQQEPGRAGFRAPPEGADALYADYERELNSQQRDGLRRFARDRVFEDSRYEGRVPEPPAGAGFASPGDAFGDLAEAAAEAPSHAKEAFPTPAKAMAMPPQAIGRGGSGGLAKRRAGYAEPPGEAPAPLPAAPTPRLDYGNLIMAPPSSSSRGLLVPVPPDRHARDIASELSMAHARLAGLRLPPGCIVEWAHTYDYAFVADGAVDVRADGAWHSIAVTARPSTAKIRHVAVPCAQADVFRIAAIENPFAGPLLPGPIDVYDHGAFLVTSDVDYTSPGGTVEIGLGVDATVKVARNVEFREEAAGMLRGALRLLHAITIDVDNLSGRSIDLEIRERIPVTREGDDEVEVILGKVDPPWERWTPDPEAPRRSLLRGGHRWRLAVPAGTQRTVRAAYEVKIAAKLELVGGNRRDA